MLYDEFGINEIKGQEVPYLHKDYENKKFNKSSFLKEWADKYVDEVRTVFDIGALDGGDSLRFASWYPKAQIHTVEASPHNFNILNKKLGTKTPNIKTYNYVMSNVNGFVTFYQTSYGTGDNYMIMGSIYDIKEEKKAKHNLKNVETITIESITFDGFCEKKGIENVDILHIDVEGATFDVVSGMNKVLPKLIFTEKEGIEFFKNKVSGGDAELVGLLNKKGYNLILELPNDYLFQLK